MKKEKIKIVRGKLKPRKSNAPLHTPGSEKRMFSYKDNRLRSYYNVMTQQLALERSIKLINLDRVWSITLIHD